ncbi:MAG: hypothetical protein ACXADB_07670 [Candidatus Hermodarchaeia archaeon]|jgi:hypothetical protein
MTEKREVKIVYRRWTILVPIIMLVSGILLMYGFWVINPLLALFGGMLILMGVLSLGVLLTMILSLELSTRSMKRQRPIPPALSEDLDREDREKEEPPIAE